MGSLTYAGAGCFDPGQLRLDVAGFFRSLRSALGGGQLPYAWVSEWHPGGHGLHVHFAVAQFIRKGVVADAWGRGFVHIGRLNDLLLSVTQPDGVWGCWRRSG